MAEFNAVVIFVLLLLYVVQQEAYKTYVNRDLTNIFIRKKRYLYFPEGSTVIFTASFLTAMLTTIPKGWNVIGECDGIFEIPTYQDILKYTKKGHKYSHKQRREIYSQFEELFESLGLDGVACIQRIMCEVRHLATFGENRLPETENDLNPYLTKGVCESDIYERCEISILNFFNT